ncbi:MAG: GDP-mannose 4,6-dehydratase [Acidobacteriota bacterium]|nr:GDP-mannose 4,6-dehydratase [Acidobacteriota bacterium]
MSADPGPNLGVVEWFQPGDYGRVDRVLADLKSLKISDLRTQISWADWNRSEGDGWYAWLLPRLAEQVRVLPCFTATPSPLGIAPKSSSPPRQAQSYADFLDAALARLGGNFEWVELWNEPDNPSRWDARLDSEWRIFSEMIELAAATARRHGKKILLAGSSPPNLNWLRVMCERGVMQNVDAAGVRGFPGNSDFAWKGWPAVLAEIRQILDQFQSQAAIWITDTGSSTWRRGEHAQLPAFTEAMESGADRVYWRELQDASGGTSNDDERTHYYGLKRADGSPKLLFRLLESGGADAVRAEMHRRLRERAPRQTLITGGAGFIGTNLARRLLEGGHSVRVFDNLSRPGVEQNLARLQRDFPNRLEVAIEDVRDANAVRKAVRNVSQVFHFAAQVAVTTSLDDPLHDFEVNVRGTLNLLEAIRALSTPPPLVFTSTNKVYGGLEDIPLRLNCTRYLPSDSTLRTGVSEQRKLDFHSPYGCSKGAADQYVLDYARTFHLPAVVFRMSCIYGPHQFGTEDQGWIAHFLIRAIEGKPIVLYGDGMQVRDVLFVEDLMDALLLAQSNMQTLSGQAFNIGGGLGNTTSLLELMDLIASMSGEKPQVRNADWRPGDQRYYVSDTRKFTAATGWAPKVPVRQGVENLFQWLLESRGMALPAVAVAGRPYEISTSQSQLDV